MSKTLCALLCLCAWFGAVTDASAVPIRIQFSGTAYSAGSTDLFDGSTISGHIDYNSDSAPTATNQLGWDTRFGDAITGFGFTIGLADGTTYVSDGLMIGGIDLTDLYYPEVDFASQGIFNGPPINGRAPVSYFFQVADGLDYGNDYPAGNPLFDIHPVILSATSLPATSFSVTEVNARPDAFMNATMQLEFGPNPNGASFYRAFYGMDSTTFTVVEDQTAPVPEPSTLWLFSCAILLPLARAIRSERDQARIL